ncbi:MAG: type II secretion system inner membrane protein GspF [Desulfobulbaceae bacterium]|nr:type II secretion system inner membrane protein GspF [Desulfobulbaceae bacterium]
MPVFEYTALDKAGKSLSGIIDADSMVAARQKLRNGGAYPVTIRESAAREKVGGARKTSPATFFSRKVKSDELHAFTRQLATLVNAGIPLVGALDTLVRQIYNPALKRIVAQVKESVNEGNSLTVALADHPKLFSNVYVNMVRAGEASGSLDVVLDRLAEFGERQQFLQSRVRAALAYPIFMAVVGAGVLFSLVAFVVPKITQVFVEMQQALPLPTIILLAVSHFLQAYWWLLLLLTVLAVLAVRRFIRSERGGHQWDRLLLRLPILGKINLKIALARFSRTLASLMQSGVSLLVALQIVRNIVNNRLLAAVIDEAIEDIREGKSMTGSLAGSAWFPPMVVQMLSVGEQSGNLEGMLGKVADVYEREVETGIMAFTALLEPAMILVMGVAVGFIVISILLPIFEMNQMIR